MDDITYQECTPKVRNKMGIPQDDSLSQTPHNHKQIVGLLMTETLDGRLPIKEKAVVMLPDISLKTPLPHTQSIDL